MVKCEVLIGSLTLDEKTYVQGDTIDLPEDRAIRMGTSVKILKTEDEEPQPTPAPKAEEDGISFNDLENMTVDELKDFIDSEELDIKKSQKKSALVKAIWKALE